MFIYWVQGTWEIEKNRMTLPTTDRLSDGSYALTESRKQGKLPRFMNNHGIMNTLRMGKRAKSIWSFLDTLPFLLTSFLSSVLLLSHWPRVPSFSPVSRPMKITRATFYSEDEANSNMGNRNKEDFGRKQIWVQVPTLPFIRFGTSGKLLPFYFYIHSTYY